MFHYFQVMDEYLDFYRWVIEGDKDLAEQYLQRLFIDVRHMNTKEEDPYIKGKGKTLADGNIIRVCKFAYTFKSKRTNNDLKSNVLPIDSRHKTLEEDELTG